MLTSTFTGLRIAGMAAAVPSYEITAEEMYARYGKEIVDKTIKMVGVKKSRKSVPQQLSSDLGYEAAQAIIKEKKICLDTIGVLLYITQTPDYKVPSSAMILHKRLGLSQDCSAMDINLGCSGFVYGLHTICAILQSLSCQRGLLIVGDVSSKLSTPDNRASSLLFGDGSAAVVVEKADSAPMHFALRSDGTRYPAIIVPGGGFRAMTYSSEELSKGHRDYPYPLMDGMGVFNFSIQDVPALIKEFLAVQGTSLADYDCLALHQANLYIMKQIAKKLKALPGQLLVSVDQYGNTSGASIPITLVDHYGKDSAGKIRILMSGFGVGLSWGVASFEMDLNNILPMVVSDDYYEPIEIDTQEYNA